MPAEDRLDATMLDAVAARLARSSSAALEASNELLAHYAYTGDAPTQRAVDTMVDHAADALRALSDSFAATSRGLKAAAGGATTVQSVDADGSSARSGRRHDHFA
jgi:hypothetical protein